MSVKRQDVDLAEQAASIMAELREKEPTKESLAAALDRARQLRGLPSDLKEAERIAEAIIGSPMLGAKTILAMCQALADLGKGASQS